jgi:hypothetical protein
MQFESQHKTISWQATKTLDREKSIGPQVQSTGLIISFLATSGVEVQIFKARLKQKPVAGSVSWSLGQCRP